MPTRRQLDAPTSNSAPPDLLTVAETAAVLRCGLTFVYESIHRYRATGDTDEIPGLKVGRSLRVPRVRLEHYIGAPITWPIADLPTVDQHVGLTQCDDGRANPVISHDDSPSPSHHPTSLDSSSLRGLTLPEFR